jgi:hypothetical protein
MRGDGDGRDGAGKRSLALRLAATTSLVNPAGLPSHRNFQGTQKFPNIPPASFDQSDAMV